MTLLTQCGFYENVKLLQEGLWNKDAISSKLKLEKAENIKSLKDDFTKYSENCANTSELRILKTRFLKPISLLKQLLAADRGDWNSHWLIVQKILPISWKFDSINNLRYGSLYLEKMRLLSEEYRNVYRIFFKGQFFAQPAIICSKSNIKTLEQGVKCV